MEELLTVKPEIGVFLMEFPGNLRKNHRSLEIGLEDKKLDKSTRVLRLRVKNTGNEALHINSFLIGEFEISSNDLNKVLENGWGQSSFSGYKLFGGHTRKSRFFLK